MPQFNDRRPTTPPEARVTKGYAARWYGGSSYSESDELEHFPNRAAARQAMQDRRNLGDRMKQSSQRLKADHTNALSLGESRADYMPAVDQSSYMDLHRIGKDGTYDPDVFHRLEFGKRGGIRRSGP